MIVLALGILDLASAILLILARFNLLENIALIAGIYLIIKGLIFIKSIPSIIDLICGVVIVLMVFGIIVPLYWLVAIWLIQKGISSLLSGC